MLMSIICTLLNSFAAPPSADRRRYLYRDRINLSAVIGTATALVRGPKARVACHHLHTAHRHGPLHNCRNGRSNHPTMGATMRLLLSRWGPMCIDALMFLSH
jgi:hypothetical protein